LVNPARDQTSSATVPEEEFRLKTHCVQPGFAVRTMIQTQSEKAIGLAPASAFVESAAFHDRTNSIPAL
jgi:hypothetical protein